MRLNKVASKNIKRYRKIWGLTQKELAETLNVSAVEIHYLETGKRKLTLNMVERISELYGVAITELLIDHEFKF